MLFQNVHHQSLSLINVPTAPTALAYFESQIAYNCKSMVCRAVLNSLTFCSLNLSAVRGMSGKIIIVHHQDLSFTVEKLQYMRATAVLRDSRCLVKGVEMVNLFRFSRSSSGSVL